MALPLASLEHQRRHLEILTGVAILALVALVAWRSPPQMAAPWDMFILLDGGWRILSGQNPNTDFNNPIGPITYQLVALGMKLTGTSIQSITVGAILFMAAASVWIALVARARFTPISAALLTIFIASLSVALRPLGFEPHVTTYAMLYNRYGWVLLSILYLQLFLQRRDGKSGVGEASSIGVLLGLILFCKVNFFVAGVIGFCVAIVLQPKLLRAAHFAILSFIVTCLAMHFVFGVGVGGYLSDIAEAGRAQQLTEKLRILVGTMKSTLFAGLMLAACWYLLVVQPYLRGSVARQEAVRFSLVFGFIIAMALVVSAGNTGERGDIPLLAIAGFILIELTRRSLACSSSALQTSVRLPLSLAVLCVIVGCMSGMFVRDVASIVRAKNVMDGTLEVERFDSEKLADFVISSSSRWQTSYWLANEAPAKINEGLGLLRSHSSRSQKLIVLGLTDPFSFALGRESARHVPLWWDLGLSHTRHTFPPPERIFSDVDIVMVPIIDASSRGCCLETAIAMANFYSEFVSRNFVEIGRTASWKMYRRAQDR